MGTKSRRRSPRYIGVDGCPGGWFYFLHESGEYEFGVVDHFVELVKPASAADMLFVDIPIGLRGRDTQERLCDKEARKILTARRSSVFPAPARAVLNASSYTEAVDMNVNASGRKISKQSWAITPKIREVDEVVRSSETIRKIVREAHPEVCFWGLAGGEPMVHYKKTQAGFEERLGLLVNAWSHSEEAAARAFLRYSGLKVSRDDVLDALVAMVTAMQPREHLRTLPASPEIDDEGLPMEMVYAVPS
ncbi:MAG: DUF429 domain-containing protein [Gammaproteobacteria bacterium]|nr:DUF429 domain-containing protein [Gammaproteobacteria bacterium]